jgi:hypothetical protein
MSVQLFVYLDRLSDRPSRLIPCLDELGGAEYSSRTVFGLHGDVWFGGLHQYGSFESVPGDGSQGLKLARVRASEYLPGGDLRRPVPASVDFQFVLGGALRHRSGLI